MKWRLDDGQIEVVDDAVAEILRNKTPGERIAIVGDIWKTARVIVEGGARSRHPDWNDAQIDAEARIRLTGEST